MATLNKGSSQRMLLTALPPEIIVGVAARLPLFRPNPQLGGKQLSAGNLLNLSLCNQRIKRVLSINSRRLKNEIAEVQYSAAHALRLRAGDVTKADLHEYEMTTWSVRFFVNILSEYFMAARLKKERKDIFQIFAAGLYVLEALHTLRIPRKDALPALFLVEAITPEIWALVRFASIGLVQIPRHNDAYLTHKHPSWSSCMRRVNTELAIEELVMEGGLAVMSTMITFDTFGHPLAAKVMRETTRRFISAVQNIPSYVDYSLQIVDPLPMPEFGFLQGLCKVRPPFSMFATSLLLTQYMTMLGASLPDGRLDCIQCVKRWKADSTKNEVEKLMKKMPRDTDWEKFYDVTWVTVVNAKILTDRCGYWKGPQTTIFLTKAAAEVLKDRKKMVDEWYVDLKNKIIMPPGAPVTKEYMIASLNITVEECGDPGNPMAGVQHPLWGGVGGHGRDTLSNMSLDELRDSPTIRDLEAWEAQNGSVT